MFNINFRIYSHSKTRIARFEKMIEMSIVPRVGDHFLFRIQDRGEETHQIKEVVLGEGGSMLVVLESEKNEDGTEFVVDDEELNGEIIDFKASNWKLESLAKIKEYR